MICLSIHYLKSTKTESVIFVLFALSTDSTDFDSFLMLQCVFTHIYVRVYAVSGVSAKVYMTGSRLLLIKI